MRNLTYLALILSSTLFLSACGQKGPLYLPDEGSANNASEPTKSH